MEEAVAAARSLCESVNEGVRERENSERLAWLQEHMQCDNLSEKLYFNSNTNCLGHRKLIYSGTLSKYKSGKELVGFLFNDFFLLATPCYSTNGMPFVFPLETSSKDKMQFRMYKKPIILNQVMSQCGLNVLGTCFHLWRFGIIPGYDIIGFTHDRYFPDRQQWRVHSQGTELWSYFTGSVEKW